MSCVILFWIEIPRIVSDNLQDWMYSKHLQRYHSWPVYLWPFWIVWCIQNIIRGVTASLCLPMTSLNCSLREVSMCNSCAKQQQRGVDCDRWATTLDGILYSLFHSLRYKHMGGACWGKEDASGSGARLLQWSQLSVPAVPVIALTTDITLTRRAHAEKKAWQLRLLTQQSCYACILQCPQAPPGQTLYASQENLSKQQWRNLSFSTISHILFCMLESLEPWGNDFVSCLVWGVWCSVSVTLQSV